jgi:hypothetical protein
MKKKGEDYEMEVKVVEGEMIVKSDGVYVKTYQMTS